MHLASDMAIAGVTTTAGISSTTPNRPMGMIASKLWNVAPASLILNLAVNGSQGFATTWHGYPVLRAALDMY